MKFVYVARKTSIREGVAILKVDSDVKFWHKDGEAGAQIDGLQAVDGAHTGRGIIIRAKLDDAYTTPRDLDGLKVFYRFYRREDKNGKNRPFLYLAARSGDAPYSGHRLVVISAQGCFLVPEPVKREMFLNFQRRKIQAQADREENRLFAGYTLEELYEMEEAA